MVDGSAVNQVIAEVEKQLKEVESTVIEKKRMINSLLSMLGLPERYRLEEEPGSASLGDILPDEFYGKALATAVRECLSRRKAMGAGPASAREIYDMLVHGGYRFDTDNDHNAIRGLRVSLSKNTQTFHKLPNGIWGLLEWYPEVERQKKSSRKKEKNGEDGEGDPNAGAEESGEKED